MKGTGCYGTIKADYILACRRKQNITFKVSVAQINTGTFSGLQSVLGVRLQESEAMEGGFLPVLRMGTPSHELTAGILYAFPWFAQNTAVLPGPPCQPHTCVYRPGQIGCAPHPSF